MLTVQNEQKLTTFSIRCKCRRQFMLTAAEKITQSKYDSATINHQRVLRNKLMTILDLIIIR